MKYIITEENIILYLDKVLFISRENENYHNIIDALKEGRPDYEIEYILNPKDVDTAKKLLLYEKD